MIGSDSHIEFVLSGKLDGVEITPSTISFSDFNEFNQQVEAFIKGRERIKLDKVKVSVEPGSYLLRTALPFVVMASLESDLKRLQREDSLGEVDPKRAEVIEKWQARSKDNPDLRFMIRPLDVETLKPIELSKDSNYRIGEIVPWVKVEKYLFGTVMNMGGAINPNVHIRLDDSNKLVCIDTDPSYLKDHSNDRLYQKVLVRVEAEQHFRTGDLRDLRLLGFEDFSTKFDEAALDRFAAAGRTAWADVPDAAQWVHELRGGRIQ